MPEFLFEAVAKVICSAKKYDFMCGVGQGVCKETFLAVDQEGDSFAIKILKPGCSNERSSREIEAMKRCSHPNIASLLELSSIDLDGTRYMFLVEPFMAGGTLQDRINKSGQINRVQALNIGESLIRAVEHLAVQDLVHRDIKPANIMFADEQSPATIGDFGIVRDLTKQSLTETYFSSGPCTPYFAAPEQLNNDKALIDWRTDQFAIATTLAASHFGFHPYRAEGEYDNQAVSRVAARFGPSAEFVHDAQMVGLPVLVKMLAPWPVQRYRTPSLLLSEWIAQRGG